MLCLNPKCRATLREYQWGEGYCSGECMEVCLDKGATLTQSLHDPSGQYTVADTLDEVDAMLEAAEIDARLPRIIYLRKQRKSYRVIGADIGVSHMECYRILHSVTRKLLRRCGLRRK